MIRIIADIILLLCVLAFPWWSSLIIIAVLFFVFDYFFEGVVIAMVVDALFAYPREMFYGSTHVMLYASMLLLVITMLIKERIRIYNQ